MLFLIIAGSAILLAGILIMLFPKMFTSLTEAANKVVADTDKFLSTHRKALGCVLILVAACIFYVAFSLKG
ncbi:hypothetical protein ACFL0T_01275 [Candidatus Omnitrophota bacterium]